MLALSTSIVWVPLAGAVIVSTPQEIALMDARRGIAMFEKTHVPVFGIVQNMAYYEAPGSGEKTYIFGEGRSKELIFSLIFCIFIVIGASIQLSAILDFADALIFVMAIPNLLGLYIMAPEVKRDLDDYWAKRMKRKQVEAAALERPAWTPPELRPPPR